ncbi:hypothetical protein Aoki45_24280 [Algoriphagus sp. oki45]|nr:hypothetical protein Aoki45_24280 [Algoriphagus sp. oki45]
MGVYIFLGFMLMNYEDFYEESEGPYWSLESMTLTEKVTYICFNGWIILNLLAIGFILYRISKYLINKRKKKTGYNNA